MRRCCPTSAGPRTKWPWRPLPPTLSPVCLSLWSAVPSSGRLLCQRAELHMDMRNFSLAVQDASSLCRMTPHWTKVRIWKSGVRRMKINVFMLLKCLLFFCVLISGSLSESHSAVKSRPQWRSLARVLRVCGAEAWLDQSQTRSSKGKNNLN